MTHNQVVKTCMILIIAALSPVLTCLGQSLGDLVSYSIVPSCESPDPNKPTEIGKYYVKLDINSLSTEEGDFDLLVDGSSILQFHISTDDIPFSRFIGPFNHSGVGGSYHEYIVRSLDFGTADTLYSPELVCGVSTSNGLNAAGYFCEEGSYGIVAQVAPEALNQPQLPEKTYVYVLVHSDTELIVDRNFSGQFASLDDLANYEVHAFAIPFEQQAEFINDIEIGAALDQDNLDICFALCGVYSLVVDCSSFDLSLEKSVQGGFVYSIGDIVVFDIIVHNDGRVTAYNIVVVDQLPDALTFLPDMNPHWTPELESHPIDSIEPGSFVNIPIYTRVNSSSEEIDVINGAEITFASNDPDNDHPAFDVDSTPDNDDEEEDDQDDAEIIILENLCSATFDIEADNEAVCEGTDLVLMAIITMATHPLQYRWRKNGTVLSQDSVFRIENHTSADYGEYSLTIIDANGCTGTEYVVIEPIDNDERFSCFSNINVGVNDNCEIFLSPDMFTSRPVSAINDYLIELWDEDNQRVDPADLSAYLEGSILEARIINPCNMETICWSNLHIEHKSFPLHDLYNDEIFSIGCHKAISHDPSEIIATFNNENNNEILDASDFEELFNQLSCLQEWDVSVSDQIVEPTNDCAARKVLRVYNIFDQEILVPVDTAVLFIQPISADSLVMPSDVNNLDCLSDIDPYEIGSFPMIRVNGKEEPLISSTDKTSFSFCNLGISYTDQVFDQSCNFGTYKVVRHWTATDWCTNSFHEDWQYLFVVDDEAPSLVVPTTIDLLAAPFECMASLNIFDYLSTEDICDSDPVITVFNHDDPKAIRLPLGESTLLGSASDKCGNSASFKIVVIVKEHSPPIAILKENLTISLTQDSDQYTNYISADFIDAGSHDSDCGPVTLLVARASEVLLVESYFNRFPIEEELRNCSSDQLDLDKNSDNFISRDELFRDQITFCCQDIESYVELLVQVIDQSGNITEAETSVYIDAKLEWTPCDDNDPCTVDDRQYGECPCGGQPNIQDFDQDNIIDCMDPSITICLDNEQREVSLDQLEDLIKKGAVGGPCSDSGQMASIAGEVFTRQGEMIEDVLITMSNMKQDITESDGYYRFDEIEMHQYYELFPERDDDPLNGVTTLDLVLLQEYILQKRSIEDPYLLIAADVNNDGKVSALDIVELRKLLLGSNDHFYNNRSWRFVIESFEFDDIRNPYNYQETNVIYDLENDQMNENWMGVKIGDINDTAIPNSLKSHGRSESKWVLEFPDISVKKGDEIRIPVSTNEKTPILGIQFSLKLESLSFLSISSAALEVHSEQYHIGKGDQDLNLVWHSQKEVDVDQELFYITVLANEDGQLKDMISLDQWNVTPLVANNAYSDIPIALDFTASDELSILPKAELFQNQPNPFNGETIIQFLIPENDVVSISFYNSNGQLLFMLSDNYSKGINAIRLTHEDLALFEGVVFYQMQYKGHITSRKMVITK